MTAAVHAAQPVDACQLTARETVRDVLPVLRGALMREKGRGGWGSGQALRELEQAVKRCELVLYGPQRGA